MNYWSQEIGHKRSFLPNVCQKIYKRAWEGVYKWVESRNLLVLPCGCWSDNVCNSVRFKLTIEIEVDLVIGGCKVLLTYTKDMPQKGLDVYLKVFLVNLDQTFQVWCIKYNNFKDVNCKIDVSRYFSPIFEVNYVQH